MTNVVAIVDGNGNDTGQFEVLKAGTDSTATELFRIENDGDAVFTGNITVSGTVDGRDLATDGSKLDGIEAGAQANVSGDSGNSAIYDNSGTPTLKSGITQGEMQTAIGGVYTDTNTNQLTVWSYDIDGGSAIDVAHGQNLRINTGNGIDINEDGPREFTIECEAASATNPGMVELATTAETTTGTDATRAVTPDGLKDSGYMGFQFRQLINAGFNYHYAAGTKVYVPLVGYLVELNTNIGRNEYIAYVAPYDGYLNQVVFRSEEACGSTSVGFHKSSTGTEVPSSVVGESVTVDMANDDTAYKFAFSGGMSGSGNQFSAGDILAISFTPTNDANDVVFTAEFILDSSSGL